MLLLEIKNILRNVPSYIEDYCMRLNKMYIPTRTQMPGARAYPRISTPKARLRKP